MAVGIGEVYEVVITVKRRSDQFSQPVGIKFYVTDIYSDGYFWKDAKVMMGLAQQVLGNFAKAFLGAARK
jgi:hypothetical protein